MNAASCGTRKLNTRSMCEKSAEFLVLQLVVHTAQCVLVKGFWVDVDDRFMLV
jgi:hypothetical protein